MESKENIHQENLSFINLRLGDKIFILNNDFKVPEISIVNIVSISKTSIGNLLLKGVEQQKIVGYTIPEENVNKKHYQEIFLSKVDCIQKFEEICVQQIIELSKAIGDIKKEN